MSIKDKVIEKAQKAKQASRKLSNLSTEIKNKALLIMAETIEKEKETIIKENEKDIKYAKEKASPAMIDRLKLDSKRIVNMAAGLREVAALPDPVGEVIKMWRRPNGLQVGKMRVPLGVIGIIYESRPNVTVDAVSLCLKSGNALILRGGSESINSNLILTKLMSESAVKAGIPEGSIQIIDTKDRTAIYEMLKLDKYIDVIIPRGGEGLINMVVENSTIPVIRHYKGICHTYVDKEADLEMAIKIAFNAKVQRPGVCNAMETLLVSKDVADKFLPNMIAKLQEVGVEIRGCERTLKIAPNIKMAVEEDWKTEYLDLILSIKIVDNVDEAIDHINKYGSMHSEAIVTSNYFTAKKFLEEVDAAAVFVNASTRFTDGHQFGLGAEMGISTQKLHSRGPMGLEDLTSTKYIILGEGQIREN